MFNPHQLSRVATPRRDLMIFEPIQYPPILLLYLMITNRSVNLTSTELRSAVPGAGERGYHPPLENEPDQLG